MALRAHLTDMRAGQFESGIIVVKRGWLPCRGIMAAFASSAFGANMHIIFKVAAHAGHRRALEFGIDVAKGALNRGMSPNQFECGLIMVKSGWVPGCCGVTGATVGTHRTLMDVVTEMAGNAV
jgi:hypothetical protein